MTRTANTHSAPYITPVGIEMLRAELGGLWQRRTEVTRALAAAAAEGDRSENAEYIYRKKELREIDRRIRYLQRRMPELHVVWSVQDKTRIYFGAWVSLKKTGDKRIRYRIVGSDEIPTHPDYISLDSPLAQALLGKRADDSVTVVSADGETDYYVVAIDYD